MPLVNTDMTITLAAQFAVLDQRQLKLVELAAKGMIDVNNAGQKPTLANWNTRIASAIALFPPQDFRNMQAQKSALYWQLAISSLNANNAVAGRSNSQILDVTSAIQSIDNWTLDALNLFLEGRSCLVSSLYT